MPAIYRQGESGRKPKVGARKIINGKEMMWNGNEYVPAPNHGGKKKTTPKPTQNTPNRPKGATGGRGGSFYTVNGITYDRKTGRPIIVPKNRQPVKAKDNTKKILLLLLLVAILPLLALHVIITLPLLLPGVMEPESKPH